MHWNISGRIGLAVGLGILVDMVAKLCASGSQLMGIKGIDGRTNLARANGSWIRRSERASKLKIFGHFVIRKLY